MMRPLTLALLFAQLSVFAVGGATALVPDMQHRFVDSGLLPGPLFSSLVAIAQAAPGPNAMVVGLVGLHIGGLAGAIAATLGFAVPPSLVTMAVGRVWRPTTKASLYEVVMKGVAPATVGLVFASAWGLMRSQGWGPLSLAVSLASAAVAVARPRLAPWTMIAGGAVFAVWGQGV
jgi:chromate transporter